MTYPIILGVLCIVMVIGMFTFIMPIFAGLMPEDQTPALSKALFSFSDFFKAKWYIILIVVVVLIFGWIYALKVPSVRLKFDYIKIKMPAPESLW